MEQRTWWGAGRVRLALLAVGPLWTAGCTDAPDLQRSSAPDLPEWSFDLESGPLIGADPSRPGEEFSRIRGVDFLSDGRLVVADGTAREVRLFSAEGDWRTSMGREGDGPGEFNAIRGVWAVGDTLIFAWDLPRSRITLFSTTGDWIEDIVVNFTSISFPRPGLLGPLGPERFLFRKSIPGSDTRDVVAEIIPGDTVELLSGTRDGTLTPSGLRAVEGGQYFVRLDNSSASGSFLFGRKVAVAVGGGRVAFGVGDSTGVRVFDSSLSEMGSVVPFPFGRPVETSWVNEERERLAAEYAEGTPVPGAPTINGVPFAELINRVQRERIAQTPAEETLPTFEDIHLDGAGRLWVADVLLPADTTVRWTIFDERLEPVARASTPRSWEIESWGVDRIALLELDAFDVPRIRIVPFGLR